MIVYNTTFSVHESAIARWLALMEYTLVPALLEDGFVSPLLMKIDCVVEEGYSNYALQLQASDRTMLDEWIAYSKPAYDADIRGMFGLKVLSFSTVMEPVAL
ncbi:MAG: DUF4286 family protein [Candidatus Aphodosoma sp.]